MVQAACRFDQPIVGHGLDLQPLRQAGDTLPVLAARYLRWNATGTTTGNWSITFRIWLSLNQSSS